MNMQGFNPKHFDWSCSGGIATLTLNRPERKNPLTFDSYAELRNTFRHLTGADDVKVVIITGAGGNFCSGGDVHDIIGPLTQMDMKSLLEFTRMTGDLIKAMIHCPQPVIAAVDGICVGAGAAIAMASDIRIATPEAKNRFFVYPRRPGRLRHGSLRLTAPDYRPGSRCRITVYRPLHVGGRRDALGIL